MAHPRNFIDVLVLLAHKEESLEAIRVQLAQNKYFTLYLAYQQLDKNNKGGISIENIVDFIGEQDSFLIEHIINHYNQDHSSGCLLFPGFISFVLPKNNASLRQQVTARVNSQIEGTDLIGIQQLLLSLFENELQLIKSLAKQKNKFDFPIDQVFASIDLNQKGFFIQEDLVEFTQRFGYSLYSEQLTFIWNRMDPSMRGRVTLDDLAEMFTPDQTQNLVQEKQQKQSEKLKAIPSDWQTNSNCFYHPMSKLERKLVKDTKDFLENRCKLKLSNYLEYQKEVRKRIIAEFAGIDTRVEWLLQKLSLRPDFNLIDCFRLFDNQQQGIIGIEDLKNTFELVLRDFALEEVDFVLVMKFLDRDLDGLVKFSDFAFQLMPKSLHHQELMKNKEANIIATDLHFNFKLFTKETQEQIKVFFIKLILLLRLGLNHRERFHGALVLRLVDLIGLLDTRKDRKIGPEQIRKVARLVEFQISEHQVNSFFLGFDYNKRSLSYEEIVDFVSLGM